MVESTDRAWRLLTLSANHGRIWFGAAAALVLTGPRGRRAAVRGLASLGGASLVANVVLKPLVRRRRPDPARTKASRQLRSRPWTSSFPSGHAASAAAFATGVGLELPPAALVVAPVAAAVAYSRVHVGVHYGTDVVAGAALGAGIALAGRALWPVKPVGPAATAPAEVPALPGGEGLTVVTNQASGSGAEAGDAIVALLPRARTVSWDPEEQDLADLVPDGTRALGVAGGDGTVASVADLAISRDLPLAVFPFGTLNHFAKALALTTAGETAAAVEAGTGGAVDVGRINGVLFLNTAGIGGYPELVRLRDRLSHRVGKWPAAAIALTRVLRRQQPLHLEINGRSQSVWLVFVGNGVYHPPGVASAWRDDLADGLLDLQYLRANRRLARTRGVLLSLLGLLDRADIFDHERGDTITLRSLDGPVLTAHDGEVTDPVEDIDLALQPRTLRVYRP